MRDTERQTKEKEIERKIETETEREQDKRERAEVSRWSFAVFTARPNDHRETPNLHVCMYVYAQFNAIFEC